MTDMRVIAYVELTPGQAEQVIRSWPFDDPWQFEYLMLDGVLEGRRPVMVLEVA